MATARIVIVGAGINGVAAAIELKKRGHRVILVDPGPLPHPLAASTDISKAIRSAYGAAEEYTALAELAIKAWRKWNEEFGIELYHETGMMFLRQEPMQPGDFEYESLRVFEKRGHKAERMTSTALRARFPAWNADRYHDGFFEPEAGYVESGRVVAKLVKRAKSLGVEFREAKFSALDEGDARVKGIVLENGERVAGDKAIVAVGAWTPYVLPFTRKFFRATGHPVFHLKPREPELFAPQRFPVFGADIATTGYYGFPINGDGVVKVANHGPGREMSPESANRTVTPAEEKDLREFLSRTFPALVNAPAVYTRICLYCDTYDGDFWIGPDPERPGLVVAAGDSGHGFKFAPIMGELIADATDNKPNPLLKKFRWREEVCAPSGKKEAARFQPQ